jgi:hypothetical protein
VASADHARRWGLDPSRITPEGDNNNHLQERANDFLCVCRQLTNVLDPVYDVNGAHIADDPIKSKPRKLPRKKNCPFYPLVTEDIEVRRLH